MMDNLDCKRCRKWIPDEKGKLGRCGGADSPYHGRTTEGLLMSCDKIEPMTCHTCCYWRQYPNHSAFFGLCTQPNKSNKNSGEGTGGHGGCRLCQREL